LGREKAAGSWRSFNKISSEAGSFDHSKAAHHGLQSCVYCFRMDRAMANLLRVVVYPAFLGNKANMIYYAPRE
jgi:hypothetical protein